MQTSQCFRPNISWIQNQIPIATQSPGKLQTRELEQSGNGSHPSKTANEMSLQKAVLIGCSRLLFTKLSDRSWDRIPILLISLQCLPVATFSLSISQNRAL